MRISVASAALLLAFALPSAHALATSGEILDAAALAALEARAEHAEPREQCFLYTQLVDEYVEVAGRQIADGDIDKANESLKRVQSFADRIHMQKDTKRLKNAETLMHAATYHLSQFMHQVSTEDTGLLQATLKRLDKLHDQLLAQVFAYYPQDRVVAFIDFLDQRTKQIDKLIIGRRQPGREEDIHDLMEQFTSIADDFDDNLDDYSQHHRDIRKMLPKVVAATERWATALKTPPENEAYSVSRKLALETLADVRDTAAKMIDEQKAWFLAHPPPKDNTQKPAPKS
jgi:hypothetical protein